MATGYTVAGIFGNDELHCMYVQGQQSMLISQGLLTVPDYIDSSTLISLFFYLHVIL